MSDKKALYIECNTGISGDMFVAALLDLGADRQKLDRALQSLKGHHVTGFDYKISKVIRSGVEVNDFDVILDEAHDGHDHDMEYLHGHSHDHGDGHVHEHYHHEHRTLSDIIHIISHAEMSLKARELAVDIFEIIAKAEAKAHGTDIDNVHFHEVGAVDSIADIVAAAVCFDDLHIDEVIIPSITEGKGMIRCQHGVLSVPVPAVTNITSDNGLILNFSDIEGELATPTGVAIAAAIKTSDKLPKGFRIVRSGSGAGKRQYSVPSILRVFEIAFEDDEEEYDLIWKLESDIDDTNAEDLGYVMERLMEEGAREVHFMPIYMKKNRPGTELVVICDAKDIDRLSSIIFAQTTTIGIRRHAMQRTVLKRFMETVDTPYGMIDVKTVVLSDGSVRKYPEYESLKKAASNSNVSIYDVRKAALSAL